MTSETLKRMWCAAEIASAHAGEGNVVPWDRSGVLCVFSVRFGQDLAKTHGIYTGISLNLREVTRW